MGKCGYCGKDNHDSSHSCVKCGTQLIEADAATGKPEKSKTAAVVLALIFGPLGLLYLGMEGMVVILLVMGVGLFALPLLLPMIHGTDFGLLISLLVRVACAAWAIKVVNRRNNEVKDTSGAEDLLDEATRLESIDLVAAQAKYQEVVEKYPDSKSAKLARSCLETLRVTK